MGPDSEVDTTTSFTQSMPLNIPHRFADTGLPRNLCDEDIGEEMAELPPPRPDTEHTPSYIILLSAGS